MMETECLACEARAGRLQLNPAPEIYSGSHWIVEHVHPTDIPGWVVLATRQHRHALHDLTPEEWLELQEIMPRLINALREVTGCDKEYVAQFAEQQGFEHVHFHVIPRAKSWPPEWRGFRVSAAMGANAKNPISAETMTGISQRLRHKLETPGAVGMRRIFHIARRKDWEAAEPTGVYATSTLGRKLEEVGFIHCSFEEQVVRVANVVFKDLQDLVLLEIDPYLVGAEVRIENLDGGDELFPHIYGPLPAKAVTSVYILEPSEDGSLQLPILETVANSQRVIREP